MIPLKLTMVQAKVTGKVQVVHYVEDLSRVRHLEIEAKAQARTIDAEKSKMKNCMTPPHNLPSPSPSPAPSPSLSPFPPLSRAN